MLVLTRKLLEKLYIGDNICITVVRLEGGQVRLGIDAPREVPVVRAELVSERRTPAPHKDSRSVEVAANALGYSAIPAPNLPAATDSSLSRQEAPIRIPQPSEAHGIDIRRRGRFR